MAPSIALNRLPRANGAALRVLDPMAGSGTTLVVARAFGHEAIGYDLDPLAVLISKAWTTSLHANYLLQSANEVLAQARRAYRDLVGKAAYPIGSDDETKEFVRYWFDAENRRQLRALSQSIFQLSNGSTRQLLLCGLSRMIIAKENGASRAMDLSHSRPHRVSGKTILRPFSHFIESVRILTERAPFADIRPLNPPRASVRRGDARNLPVESESIDYVITSPPYLNAIDYMRCSKFSLVWMGYNIRQLRAIRGMSVGSDRGQDRFAEPNNMIVGRMCNTAELSTHDISILRRYVSDLDAVMREVARVLKKDGKAVLVVGNSSVRGVFLRNSYAVRMLGERHSLVTRSVRRRQLEESRRYLPPPSSKCAGQKMRNRMREEVIITLSKEPTV